MERLSSGKRINHARDDAAGMAIAEGMTSQIKGMNQAVRNTNDGISLVQTADGAMEGITSKLQRMRELAVQAANGTYSTSDRSALDTEVQALIAEIDRVADNTTFNGNTLLGGTFGTNVQVGDQAGNVINISTISSMTEASLGLASLSVGGQTAASSAIATIDGAISTVNTARATLGSTQNRFETTVADLKNTVENLSSARSRIQDADFASETANLAKNQILQQAGMAMLAQANQLPQAVLSLLR